MKYVKYYENYLKNRTYKIFLCCPFLLRDSLVWLEFVTVEWVGYIPRTVSSVPEFKIYQLQKEDESHERCGSTSPTATRNRAG